MVNTYGPQTRGGGGGQSQGGQAGSVGPEMGPPVRTCGNTAIEERLHNIESHLKLPTGEDQLERAGRQRTRLPLKNHTVPSEERPTTARRLPAHVISLLFMAFHSFVLLPRGSSSPQCLPAAEDAGGSDPGAGGPLSRVFPVQREFSVVILKLKWIQTLFSSCICVSEHFFQTHRRAGVGD